MDGRRRPRLRARPRRALGLVARRRRRRLLARRRHGLARPQARPGRQQRHRDRDRHRRRPPRPRRRAPARRPVLGAARRRRELRRRHRDGVPALRARVDRRRRDALAGRAGPRGPPRVERVDEDRARRGHDLGAPAEHPGHGRRAGHGPRPLAGRHRRRRHRHGRGGGRDPRAAARAVAGDRHVRPRPADRPLLHPHGPGGARSGRQRHGDARRGRAGADGGAHRRRSRRARCC